MKHQNFLSKWIKTSIVFLSVIMTFGLFGINQSTVFADTGGTVTVPQTVQLTDKITDEQYRNASASQLAAMVRSGQVTPQELVHHAFSVLAQDNPSLNAVIYTREQQALDEASQLKDTGQPFYGVPLLVKGLMQLISGGPNTNGLLPLKGNTTSATLPITKAFQNAGFIVIGVTNFPEMGLINVTTSKLYGPASNPWNKDYNPGGSSGGAAASTADGMVPLAGGNDAGGSIRIPASWTGLIGLKPTQGIISGDSATPGAVNFAETKTMKDTNSLFNSLLDSGKADQVPEAPSNLKGMTIAYSTKSPVGTPVSSGAIQAVNNAVSFLKSQGFNMVEVDPPVDGVKLMQAYYLRATSSGSTASFIIKQKTKQDMTFDQVSPMTWALYQASKKLPQNSASIYNNELNLINQQMTAFHERYPLYLTPTTATTAPRNDDPAFLPEYVEQLKNSGNLDSSQQMQLIYDAWLHGLSKTPFTQLANLSGDPAISLPTYVSPEGMPLGIQFEAGKNQDRLLLKMGDLFENNGLFKELKHQSQIPTPSVPTPSQSSSSQVPSTSSSTSLANSSDESSISSSNESQKPNLNDKNEAKKQPIMIYTLKKVYLYRHVNFSRTNRLISYAKRTRVNRPMFKVVNYVRDDSGRLRYEVMDINSQSKTFGQHGYLTANSKYVQPVYYQNKPAEVRVISKNGLNEYRRQNLSGKVKHDRRGTVLKIKGIKISHLTTRFILQNGHFISANKKIVISIK
ncbi:MAG: amidase family protein [Lentilactobacillus hilgardii]